MVACTGLTWLSQSPLVPQSQFMFFIALAWSALISALFLSRSQPQQQPPPWRLIMGYALFARAICCLALPIYEDDGARYLWDGWMTITARDPYALPPAHWFTAGGLPIWTGPVLDTINHPDLPTIYGPGCQLGFMLAACLKAGSWWAWKVILGGAELATLCLVSRKFPPHAILVYAWCPLGLCETWINGHPDALAVLPLTAAFIIFHSRPWLAGTLLGIALATRLHLVPIALVFVVLGGWRIGFTAGLAVISLYLPFMVMGSDPGLHTTMIMAATWEFNSFLPAILRPWCGVHTVPIANVVSMCGTVAIVILCRQRKTQLADTVLVTTCWWLFCALVVNPWYVVALLPFAAYRLQPWVLGIMAALPLSYVRGITTADGVLLPFDHAWWIRPGEVAIAIGLGLLLARALVGGRPDERNPPMTQFSVLN